MSFGAPFDCGAKDCFYGWPSFWKAAATLQISLLHC